MWFKKNTPGRDYFKYFIKRKGIRVGFCSRVSTQKFFLTPYYSRYNSMMASTRLRVNDIIYYSLFSDKINARFFNPLSSYDILIFQKEFSKKAYSIASKFKKRNTKIIFDINVNYFSTKSDYITKQQNKNIMNFISITDLIITTTDYLKNYILENDIFPNVVVIPEIISNEIFNMKKIHFNKDQINLLYIGYSAKAKELEIIKEPIEQLNRKYKLRLITICEKTPKLNINIKKKFIKYRQVNLPKRLLKEISF